MEEFMPILESAAMTVGGAVAGAVDVFTEAFSQMTADPRALARDIALQLIMFTLTTVILGSLYHRFVLRPREMREIKLADARRASLMEPFRRMLVMRLAGAHGGLYDKLTRFDDWGVNWGRPRIRSLSADVADICANLSATIISNAELLTDEERQAVGKYSSQLFALQGKLEEIEKSLASLSTGTVDALRGIIIEANATINQIATAFDTEYKDQLMDLLWDADDGNALEERLLTPLDGKVAAIARKAAVASAPPPPAMAAE
jgi:hypothetical protein